ncbi:WD domain, G-beta repeat-containing protein [Toxoplasma gondii p89]|uniref:WD domain, G-beta repeat-containing protein n=1 Tax=Toxoplasma gondii p89 TaxID=943119 RepID=A0A086KYY7_TOXGO|nr:WD domain, G-beta repeat-containing protein [Toxoplasma gondii p89]
MKKKSRKSVEATAAEQDPECTYTEEKSSPGDARCTDTAAKQSGKKKRGENEERLLEDGETKAAKCRRLRLGKDTLRSTSPSVASSSASCSPSFPCSPSSAPASPSSKKKKALGSERASVSEERFREGKREKPSWGLAGGSLVHRASVFLCSGKVLATPRGETFTGEAENAVDARTRELCFFSAKSGKLLYVTHGHTDTITSVMALPPNPAPRLPSSLALSASLDRSLCLWTAPAHPISSGEYLLHRLYVGSPILAAAYAPGSREVFLLVQGESLSGDGTASRRSPTYGVCVLSLGEVLSPPATSQVSVSGPPQFCLSPEVLFSFSLPPTSFCVSQSGAFLAATAGKRLLLFARQLNRLLTLRHVDRLVQVSIHPTDEFVVAGDRIGRILAFFCLADLNNFLSFGVDVSESKLENACDSKTHAPSSRRLSAAVLPPPVSLVASALGSGRASNALPDAAASGKKSVGLPASLSPVILHWHAHAVTALAFSADGLLLLSGGEEGVLVLWHTRQAFHRQFLPRLGAPIFHVSSVSSLGASGARDSAPRDGEERVAVSCGDNSVKLVDLVRLHVAAVIQGLDLPLAAFAYSPSLFSSTQFVSSLASSPSAQTETGPGTAEAAATFVCSACSASGRRALKQVAEADSEGESLPASTTELGSSKLCSSCGGKARLAAPTKSVRASPGVSPPLRARALLAEASQALAPAPRRSGLLLSSLLPLPLSQARAQSAERRLAVPSFLRPLLERKRSDAGGEGQRLSPSAETERRGLLLFSGDASRLQVYDAERDKHVFHLPIRPQRMYTSRVDDAFSACQWEIRFAAADLCCSSLAVVESRGAATAARGAETRPKRRRIEDVAVPDGRCHSITFWVYEGENVANGEDGKFSVKTRIDGFHVNEVTALQPHTREPRFFFTLSMDTYFKAWREVSPPSSSSSPSFFACVLEGSYRGLAPLSCSLSLDASLLAIAHGGSLITLWKASSFSLSHTLRLPPSATLRKMATASSGSSAHTDAVALGQLADGSETREEDVEEVCDKVALLETAYGFFLVAGTTTCVVLYDLLSLAICWVKSFFDEGGLVDFLFVEPGGGPRFAVVLAKLTVPACTNKDDEEETLVGETAREPNTGASELRARTCFSPSHEVSIFTLSSRSQGATELSEGRTKKTKKGGKATSEHGCELPLLPRVGPLRSAGAENAAEGAGQGDSGVYVHCIWEQERSRLGDAVLSGCFLPPASSPLDVAKANAPDESVLMLLNARFQLETIRVPAGTVSPTDVGVCTRQGPGDVVEEPDEEPQQPLRKVQQLLQVERAKASRAAEAASGDSDDERKRLAASAVSDVAPLFCQAMAAEKGKRDKSERTRVFTDFSGDSATPSPGVFLQRLWGRGQEEEDDDESAEGEKLSSQLLAATEDREEVELGPIKQKRNCARDAELDRLKEDAEALRAREENKAAIKRAPKHLLASLVATMEDSEDSD